MNYYSHHIGDFNNSTRHLTRVERALYRDLIELYYDTEQPLQSTNFDTLARKVLANSDEEKAGLKLVLDEFFTIEHDGYHQDRCDKELAKYRANATAKAKAGIASAAARQQKLTKGQQKATGVKQVCNKPITNNQEPRTNNQEESKPDFFDLAWQEYPSRPGASKAASLKAWRARIKSGVDPESILAGVARYSAYCKAENIDQRFIKQPATFFGPDEHYLSAWAIPPPASSKPAKFDPVAHVNQNRKPENEPIDITPQPVA